MRTSAAILTPGLVRAVLDHFAHEFDAETAGAVCGKDVDVREVCERRPVRERAREADLAIAVVEADDALRSSDEPFDDVARPARGPVGLVGEEVVHRVDVDTRGIVVEDKAVGQLAAHVRSLAKRCRRAVGFCVPWGHARCV